jgi:hypothetical protein
MWWLYYPDEKVTRRLQGSTTNRMIRNGASNRNAPGTYS